MQDWDVFRYVLAIQRHGGLSGAARELGVTHATVSRQLARAEEMLGAKLFDRMPSGLTATAAGRAALARAEAAEAELIALDLSLMDQDKGALRITVPPLMMRAHLASDIRDFNEAYPGIELMIRADNRVFNLHRREADIAIRVSRKPAESLWGRKVADQQAGYFVSNSFLARHGPALDRKVALPVISFDRWSEPIPKDVAANFPHAYVAASCDDMMAGLELVKAGLGLTRVPFFIARHEPDLVLLDALPITGYGPVWLLTHPDLRRTPIVQLAMRFLSDRFKAAGGIYLSEK